MQYKNIFLALLTLCTLSLAPQDTDPYEQCEKEKNFFSAPHVQLFLKYHNCSKANHHLDPQKPQPIILPPFESFLQRKPKKTVEEIQQYTAYSPYGINYYSSKVVAARTLASIEEKSSEPQQ